jgi:hypothetical protein
LINHDIPQSHEKTLLSSPFLFPFPTPPKKDKEDLSEASKHQSQNPKYPAAAT